MKTKVKNYIMIGIIILCIIGIILVIYNNQDNSNLNDSLAYFTNSGANIVESVPIKEMQTNNYYNIWLILFNLILSINITYLCLSRFNHKSIKITYDKIYKIIILIVVTLILTVGLTVLENLFI